MKRIFLILLSVLIGQPDLWAQPTMRLSLQECMYLATSQSVQAQRSLNVYRSGYWAYRAFRAKQRPQLALDLRPIEFNRATVSRYDYEQNIDIYREQRNLSNYGNLSLTQNIPWTGGRIYLDTDLGRLANFGETDLTTYRATWLRLGIDQPLFGFNELKWEKRTEQLRFEKHRRDFLVDQQKTYLEVVDRYFDLILSRLRLDMARKNFHVSDTLYRLGLAKKDLLAVSQEELLNLELASFNAQIETAKAQQSVSKAEFSINALLNLPAGTHCETLLPEPAPIEALEPDRALALARKNNPELLQCQLQRLEADKTLERSSRESRFRASVQASLGLNQYNETLPGAYRDPLNQEIVALSLRIPLLDWGQGRGDRQMAHSQREVAYAEATQLEANFEQAVRLKLLEFELQPKQIEGAKKAKQVAALSFDLARARFVAGKSDVLQLTTAMQNNQLAQEKYLLSLLAYWRYYYELQQLTLWDLSSATELNADFDSFVEP